MTTATRVTRDWKLTLGHRILMKVAWAGLIVAAYGAAVAVIAGLPGAWWLAGAGALVALLAGLSLPEPVPHDMLTGEGLHRTIGRP